MSHHHTNRQTPTGLSNDSWVHLKSFRCIRSNSVFLTRYNHDHHTHKHSGSTISACQGRAKSAYGALLSTHHVNGGARFRRFWSLLRLAGKPSVTSDCFQNRGLFLCFSTSPFFVSLGTEFEPHSFTINITGDHS